MIVLGLGGGTIKKKKNVTREMCEKPGPEGKEKDTSRKEVDLSSGVLANLQATHCSDRLEEAWGRRCPRRGIGG